MKNSYIKKLTIIIILSILTATGSVLVITYSLSYRALVNDMRIRTEGVKEHITAEITLEDIRTADSPQTQAKLKSIQTQIQNYISITRLYIAKPGETTNPDLATAINKRELVTSPTIRNTEDGAIFGAYWPVLNSDGDIEGVICMEYSADSIQETYKTMLLYSIAISAFFLIFISITARLIMSKTSDDFYKKLAYTDILTGYDNRMAFEADLIKAETHAKSGIPTAIMVFDLNNLKEVNDALGHKEGDTLIKNTADIINSHIKQYGRLYRVGGDEFAAILTNQKWQTLQEIIQIIHNENKETLTNHPFSCAAGMSRFDKTSDHTLHDTLRRADDAMYENKRLTKRKALKIDEIELNNIEKLRQTAKAERAAIMKQ